MPKKHNGSTAFHLHAAARAEAGETDDFMEEKTKLDRRQWRVMEGEEAVRNEEAESTKHEVVPGPERSLCGHLVGLVMCEEL